MLLLLLHDLILLSDVSELPENPQQIREEPQAVVAAAALNGSCSSSSCTTTITATTTSTSTANGSGATNNSCSVFASLFASSTASGSLQSQAQPAFTDLIRAMGCPDRPADLSLPAPSSSEAISLCLSTNHGPSIFGTGGQLEYRQYMPTPQPPAMSATALLQKAAQMDAAATNASLLRGLGIVSSSSAASTSSGQQDSLQWGQVKVERDSDGFPSGLGLGLPSDGGSGLKELMMGTPSVFGDPKQTTLDFLGLGMAVGGSSGGGISALMTSISGGFDVTTSFGNGGEFSGKDIGRSS